MGVRAPAPPPRGTASAESFTVKNPFRIRPNRTPDPPPPAPTRPPAPPPTPPPPPTIDASTKFKLLGTFLVGDDRFAVINVISKSKEDVYKEGDQPLPNSRITRIEPRRVRLLVDGREAVIEIDYSDWRGGMLASRAMSGRSLTRVLG